MLNKMPYNLNDRNKKGLFLLIEQHFSEIQPNTWFVFKKN